MNRSSGVLMHISTLWGDYSCGSFGSAAKEFVDLLAGCGFSWWQVLPFCPTDEYNSPYKSYSTFAGNPYFVDLPTLFDEGLITREELDAAKQKTPYACEFESLAENRIKLLFSASKRVADKSQVEEFVAKNPYIADYCEFMALKDANEQKPWWEWTTDVCNPETLFMHKFIQFKFHSQWQEVKKYANEKGVKIIGDIPFYVAQDSSDVWRNKEMFLLDKRDMPTAVAGVPPDYFAEDGQLWGNPLYNWAKMKADGYRWWLDRMNFMLDLFDGVRIDHFRAFSSFWSVPYGDETARNGHWEIGPGMDLISKFKELAGDKLIIAEDLGDIDEDVIKLVEDSGFPGMRVFQFGFFGGDSTHRPHHYINNSVAYSGTHDNNTLLGYLWELSDQSRKEMLTYCGYTDADWEKGFDSMLRTLYVSSAGLLILPVQDLLGYGSDTRLNTPGKADGNWSFRITKDQLNSINKEKFIKLNKTYFR